MNTIHYNDNITIFKTILVYSLSLSVALGFNDLIITIFNKFNKKNDILSKIIYVLIVFIITMIIITKISVKR
jgi:hypothetical protein